jgi:hypothetical protein
MRGGFSSAVLVTVLTTAVLAGGCSSPASREAMTPLDVTVGKQHPFSVAVKTGGGADTGALDSSNISDADLKAAIEESIVRSQVFRKVVQGADGDYELNVRVTSLTKTIFGATFTVEMEAAWSLVRLSDRTPVMRKSIKSEGVATISDAVVAVTRLRLAVETAARSNIKQGIGAISELPL